MGDQDTEFSQKELQQLVMILRSLKEGPLTNTMIDIPKFAEKTCFTAGSARNALVKLRKKLDEGEITSANSGAASPPSDGKAKKAPTKKVLAKDNPEKEESPEKKPQAPRKNKAKVESNGA